MFRGVAAFVSRCRRPCLGIPPPVLRRACARAYGYGCLRIGNQCLPSEYIRLREGKNELVLKNKYGEDRCTWYLGSRNL